MKPGVVTSIDCTGVKGLHVSKLSCWVPRPTRCVRYLAGFGVGVNYGVHTDSLLNITRGIAERVLYIRRGESLGAVPQPERGVFNRLAFIRQRLLRSVFSTPIVDREEYPSLYTGRRRTVYQRAYESLCAEAVTRRDAVVKTFLKAEKINFSSKVDPAPRVIQPRSPRYNLEVGRYLKPAEKAIMAGFKRVFGYPVIVKGMNADMVGRTLHSHWSSFKQPVAVGLDASRFDQHVSTEALKWEHSIYNGLFNSPELAKLLTWQLVNRGVAIVDGHRVKYQVEGKRMSGDINTGLGNCILMSSIVIGYLEERGIDARLANNGDDCILVLESTALSQLDDLDRWFLEFGFTLTREKPVYHLEEVEFCQAHPVLVGSGYRMVRDPRVAMSKDCVSIKGWESELDVRYWCHAISCCGMSLTSGVPVWHEWYSALARHGVKPSQGYMDTYGVSGMSYMAEGVEQCGVTDEARVSFWRAFGILPDMQIALESHYRTMDISLGSIDPMMFPDIKALDITVNPLARWLDGKQRGCL